MPENNIQQVLFKKGLQANLNALTANQINPGTFYITEDSHRIYFGITDDKNVNKVVPLSSVITVLENQDKLPSSGSTEAKNLIGQLVYLEAENILCITANGDSWTQINPDTNTYITENKIQLELNNNKVNIINELTNNDNAVLEASWSLEGDNTITLSLTGESGSQTLSFHCELSLGTKESKNNNEVQIVLQDKTTQDISTIAIKGDDYIAVDLDDDGNITFNASALNDAGIEGIAHSVDQNGTFTTKLIYNDNSVQSDTFKPIIHYGLNNETAVFVKDTTDDASGIADLSVYTIDEVNNLIADAKENINAMSYKGVTKDQDVPIINDTSIFCPENVSIGDTWKVGQSNRYTITGKYISNGIKDDSEEWARVGDLLIANSRTTIENENGVIDQEDLIWEHIESGDDDNNIYTAVLTPDHGFIIQEKSESGTPNILQFALSAGTQISLADTQEESDSTKKTVTVNHASIATTSTKGQEVEQSGAEDDKSNNIFSTTTDVSVITAISTADNGHVTEITTSPITLIDTNATVDTVELSSSADSGIASLTTKVGLHHPSDSNYKGDYKESTIEFASNNTNIKVGAGIRAIDGEKSINQITFDLVWGSF